MIEIRRCKKEDWASIVKLMVKREESLPDLKNIVSAAVVVKDGEVIGFGYICKYVEATFFPDASSKKNVVSSLKLLSEQLVSDAKELDIDVVHVFSKDPGFTDILKTHFKYEDCSGDAICLEVPNV